MPAEHALYAVAENVWAADDWQPVAPGVVFPNRMVVLRLADGGLWLHSPLALERALADALDALGAVRWIVEPNLFHHLHAGAARQRWPDAALVGLPGHARKRPDLDFAPLDEAASRWKPELETLPIAGIPALEERVFFHGPSSTLIVTDLVFHMRATRGWATPLLLRAVGAHGRLAQSRSLRFMTRDRSAAAASARAILEWPFERVVMSHGEILGTSARAQMQEALRQMLTG